MNKILSDRQNKAKFKDLDFPAQKSSLLDSQSNNGGLDNLAVKFFEKIVWRRPEEIIIDGQISIFG